MDVTRDVKAFLKKYTTVSNSFIDDFFSLYTITSSPSDYVIDLQTTAKWLKSRKGTLKHTLTQSYVQDIDYTISKPLKGIAGRGKAKTENIMITADCFKALCMQSKTKKAVEVRAYFLAVEKALFLYREEIMQGMFKRIGLLENNQKGKSEYKNIGGVIYVIKASNDMDSVYKIGKTINLVKRLRSHSSAQGDDLEVVYVYKTSCIDRVEKCIKVMLKEKQYRKHKEVYQVDLSIMKNVIDSCNDACMAVTYRKRGKSKLAGGYYAVLAKDTLLKEVTRL